MNFSGASVVSSIPPDGIDYRKAYWHCWCSWSRIAASEEYSGWYNQLLHMRRHGIRSNLFSSSFTGDTRTCADDNFDYYTAFWNLFYLWSREADPDAYRQWYFQVYLKKGNPRPGGIQPPPPLFPRQTFQDYYGFQLFSSPLSSHRRASSFQDVWSREPSHDGGYINNSCHSTTTTNPPSPAIPKASKPNVEEDALKSIHIDRPSQYKV